jgi:CRISPR-associated endonuclease/helicase Cas3
MNKNWFKTQFQSLTAHAAYPWQIALFESLVAGEVPRNLSLPTGSGKTSVIPVWLLARIQNPALPRRLVYVVDRRSVVDQATKVVEQMVANLPQEIKEALAGLTLPDEALLGVSSLRGEFEDNEEWSKLPFRSSVLIGTVDKVGSGLLFSAYGEGSYAKPRYAGLLGNDTLVIFDECHLVPAFQTLLENVEAAGGKLRPFHTMTMSATSSGDDITLSEDDLTNPVLGARLNAKKKLNIIETTMKVTQQIVKLARTNLPKRTIVFVNSPRTAVEVAEALRTLDLKSVVALTGTIRGKERDDLIDNPIFRTFMTAEEPAEPHFLVATSAGEVGIDLTCSRMISEMAKAGSLVQRFGRANRFAEAKQADLYVVYKQSEVDKLQLQDDLAFIQSLRGDASTANVYAHRELLAAITSAKSVIPILEPAVLDILSMTSLKNAVDVDAYLRGKQATTHYVEIAWRVEVPLLAQMSEFDREQYFKRMGVKSFEKLNETARRAEEVLQEIGQNAQAILIDAEGENKVVNLLELDRSALRDAVLILPPTIGGLASGMFSAQNRDGAELDIATLAHKHHEARNRIISAADAVPVLGKTEREVFKKEVAGQVLIVRKAKDTRRSETVSLSDHSEEVRKYARLFAEKSGLEPELVEALEEAGVKHDLGKANAVFQLAIGNKDVREPLAKSGSRMNPWTLNGYRHEFESVVKTQGELAKHVVGSHHSGARPTFTGNRALSPINRNETAVVEQINRFAELQNQYGWWGLAYLDAMLKCADAYASGE